MDQRLVEINRLLGKSIVSSLKRSDEQKQIFLSLWEDTVLQEPLAKEFGCELQLEGREPVITSRFGKIHVQFDLVVHASEICNAAVFWYHNSLQQREDVYKVYLKWTGGPWSDGSADPLDWDGMNREANPVTMGQIVRRALAASLHKTTMRIAGI